MCVCVFLFSYPDEFYLCVFLLWNVRAFNTLFISYISYSYGNIFKFMWCSFSSQQCIHFIAISNIVQPFYFAVRASIEIHMKVMNIPSSCGYFMCIYQRNIFFFFGLYFFGSIFFSLLRCCYFCLFITISWMNSSPQKKKCVLTKCHVMQNIEWSCQPNRRGVITCSCFTICM